MKNSVFISMILALVIVLAGTSSAVLVLRSNSNVNEIIYDEHFYTSMGNQYMKLGDVSNAIISYEDALKLNPNNIQARHNLAIIYHQSGEYQKSIDQLRFLVVLEPSNPVYAYDLAINLADNLRYNEVDNLDEAIFYFELADKLESGYARSKENLEVLKQIKAVIS
jgi:tetratricopeptide (TPR) repeat protein